MPVRAMPARRQRVYAELAVRQVLFESAEPSSLPWEFRNDVLEPVEKLPEAEQKLWKNQHLASLKTAAEPLQQYQARQRTAARLSQRHNEIGNRIDTGEGGDGGGGASTLG